MTSAFDTSDYNVEATIVAWVAASIATYPPPLASGAVFRLNAPEEPMNTPVFALDFVGTQQDGVFQGRTVGTNENGEALYGMFRITMYASRGSDNWRAQLAQMSDTIRKAYKKQPNGAIVIKDFYTSNTAPADTTQRLTLVDFDRTSFPISLNPDIEGAAIHITYQYVERA